MTLTPRLSHLATDGYFISRYDISVALLQMGTHSIKQSGWVGLDFYSIPPLKQTIVGLVKSRSAMVETGVWVVR